MGVSGNRQRSSLGESDAAKARWEPHALLETNLEKILLALGSLPDETRARVVRVLYKTFVSPQVSSVWRNPASERKNETKDHLGSVRELWKPAAWRRNVWRGNHCHTPGRTWWRRKKAPFEGRSDIPSGDRFAQDMGKCVPNLLQCPHRGVSREGPRATGVPLLHWWVRLQDWVKARLRLRQEVQAEVGAQPSAGLESLRLGTVGLGGALRVEEDWKLLLQVQPRRNLQVQRGLQVPARVFRVWGMEPRQVRVQDPRGEGE